MQFRGLTVGGMDESGLDEIDKMTKIISTVTRVMIRYR